MIKNKKTGQKIKMEARSVLCKIFNDDEFVGTSNYEKIKMDARSVLCKIFNDDDFVGTSNYANFMDDVIDLLLKNYYGKKIPQEIKDLHSEISESLGDALFDYFTEKDLSSILPVFNGLYLND